MKIHNNKNGFTLIELIIVMVILGITAAVAVPRYLDSIANAEKSAEDAVLSAIQAGLKQYANNSLLENGRASWPENPFDALSEKPAGYTEDGDLADTDGEWTFIPINTADGTGGEITHQRADNSRFTWYYDSGTQEDDKYNYNPLGDQTAIGNPLGPRTAVGNE